MVGTRDRTPSCRRPGLALVGILLAAGASGAAEIRERTTSFGERQVAWSDSGSGGETLVLVHGWASDRRAWRFQLPTLGEHHRVIAIDLPGHGASEPPKGDYDMALFADAVAAVLEDAGVGQAVMIGHSNGTPVVRELYRRHPQRVRALVIVDGALRSFVTEEMASSVLDSLRSEGWGDFVAAFVDGMPGSGLDPAVRAEIRDMARSQRQEAVIGGFEAALDPAIWRDDAIEVPVLMLLAEQPAWSPEYERWVRERVPRLDWRMWSGVSHFLMMERPAEFDRSVLEFVASLDAR